MPIFFATASRGTEAVLADELRGLGAGPVEPRPNGVAFGETLEQAYRACLGSRVASRVLLPLATFEVRDAESFYAGVHAIDWLEHLGPERTLAVDTAGHGSPAGPPNYLTLKAKDAIVDRIRAAQGSRPSVDTANPDVRVNVHVAGPATIVSLDLGGRGLHRRGIGRTGAAAPLRENLAAAVLRIAGWPARAAEGAPLFDPLCGSATLLVEAAGMALDVAPGLARGRIGAEGWRGHDAALWRRVRAEAEQRRAAARGREIRIAGSDAGVGAIAAAKDHVSRAGLASRIRIQHRELAEAVAPWPVPGVVVTNPPYGERIGAPEELGPLYELLGDVLKRRFPGWTAWVLVGAPALAKRIGLRPASRSVLYNGPIECRLIELPIDATPATGARGPAWRKPSAEAEAFAGKLRKNLRRLAPWATREGLDAYRVYDADMHAYNLAVDRYGQGVRVEEYAAPARIDPQVAERHLRDALLVVAEVLEVDPAAIVLRVRRKRAPGEQAGRRDDRRRLLEVREGDLRFLVNLTDYLDTGLFLDDRRLRQRIRERAGGGAFLNLFAHTCTATVAAAAGGARETTSVDLSRTYLDWGRRNLVLNGFHGAAHRLVRADAREWLARGGERGRYDSIFLAPPTWSRSRAMHGELDVQRDHAELLRNAARLLAPQGEILFATSRREFELGLGHDSGLAATEITAEVTPPDFAARPRLRAWSVVANAARAPRRRSTPAARPGREPPPRRRYDS